MLDSSSVELEALIEDLQDENIAVRRKAAIALGNSGNREAVQPLIKAFNGEGTRVMRCRVAEALGKLKDVKAIEPLVAALGSRDSQLCEYIAAALSKFGYPALFPLLDLLKSNTSLVRADAAYCLGFLGEKEAIEPLIKLLKDEDEEVRACAVIALGKIGDNSVLPYLLNLTADPTYVTKLGMGLNEAASKAISRINSGK